MFSLAATGAMPEEWTIKSSGGSSMNIWRWWQEWLVRAAGFYLKFLQQRWSVIKTPPRICHRKTTAGRRGRRWTVVGWDESWVGLRCHRKRGRGRPVSGAAEVSHRIQREDGLPQLPQPAVAIYGSVSWQGGTTQPGTEPLAAQVHHVSPKLAWWNFKKMFYKSHTF